MTQKHDKYPQTYSKNWQSFKKKQCFAFSEEHFPSWHFQSKFRVRLNTSSVVREGLCLTRTGELASLYSVSWQPRLTFGDSRKQSEGFCQYYSLCDVKVAQLCLTLCNPMEWPWDSPGQNTWVGSLSLLQGIFPTQGLNPGLPHCRQILYQLSHKGSPLASHLTHTVLVLEDTTFI